MNCWQYLALEPTSDLRAIKKAYALQLKLINQETDTEAFIRLTLNVNVCGVFLWRGSAGWSVLTPNINGFSEPHFWSKYVFN